MGLWITQREAARFGEHSSLRVTLPASPQVERVGRKWNEHMLLYVLRIDHQAIAGHPHSVEDIGIHHKEASELTLQLREIYTPLRDLVARGYHPRVVELVES